MALVHPLVFLPQRVDLEVKQASLYSHTRHSKIAYLVHNDPEHAWSDGAQTLTFDNYRKVVDKCHKIAAVIGRE